MPIKTSCYSVKYMAVVSFRALVGAYQNSHSVERDGCPGSTLQIIFHLQRGMEVEGVSQMYTNVDKGGGWLCTMWTSRIYIYLDKFVHHTLSCVE